MQRQTPVSWLAVFGGFASGIGFMYYFDPDRGRYRRSLIRDQFIHLRKTSGRAINHRSRDLGNRAQGLVARVRSSLTSSEVSDDILVARVASRIGRLISHPHPIELTAESGVIHLGGPVLRSEVERLIEGVSRIRGIRGVVNHLEVIEGAEKELSQAASRRATGAA